MFDAHLRYLVCPRCKKELQIEKVKGGDVITESGNGKNHNLLLVQADIYMWPIFKLNRRLFSPKLANRLNWRLLVPDYTSLGLDEAQLKEWAYLNFFDMLSPAYDRPIKLETFRQYLAMFKELDDELIVVANADCKLEW